MGALTSVNCSARERPDTCRWQQQQQQQKQQRQHFGQVKGVDGGVDQHELLRQVEARHLQVAAAAAAAALK
jgi:hypothetical protein